MFMKSFYKYFVTQSKPQDAKGPNEQGYFAVKDVDGSFCEGRGAGSSQAGKFLPVLLREPGFAKLLCL